METKPTALHANGRPAGQGAKDPSALDIWAVGTAYEAYVGRWSRRAPGALQALFDAAGLVRVETRAIDVPTTFRDFDEYWAPFLGGQGPAPGYAMSLPEERRMALRERIRSTLPIAPDGTLSLTARAWMVSGRKSDAPAGATLCVEEAGGGPP